MGRSVCALRGVDTAAYVASAMETLSNLWYMMELNSQHAEAMLEKLVRRQGQEAAHIAIAVKVDGDTAE